MGVVTLENAHWNLKYEVGRQEKTAELHKSSVNLGLDSQKDDIEIEAKNVGRWKVEMVRRDDHFKWPTRFQLVDYSGADEIVLRDFVRVPPEGDRYFGLIKNMREPDKSPVVQYGDLLMTKKDGKTVYVGKITFDYLDIKIEDDSSPEGIIVKYQEDVPLPVHVDEERSKKVQIHEEQHQFNKLFMPWEIHFNQWRIMLNAAENAKTPDEAEQKAIRDLVKWHRRDLVDKRARDEILAQYSGGRNPEETYTNLVESSLYDYYDQAKDKIEKLPKEIAEHIAKDMSVVTWEKRTDEDGYVHDDLVNAFPLQVDEAAVKEQIEVVFKDDYRRDLKKWVNAIKVLETKGHGRDEVLAILAQEPARNWPGLARRLGAKESK